MIVDRGFDQTANRYLNSLTHLHSANGHNVPVCWICRGPTGVNHMGRHWELCWRCKNRLSDSAVNAGELADATGFIIYVLKNLDDSSDQALRDMYGYKLTFGRSSRQDISEAGQRIRVLLYVALRDNLADLQMSSVPVTMIMHVPSTSTRVGRDPYALGDAIDSSLGKLHDVPPHQQLLVPGVDSPAPAGTVDPARFSVCDPNTVVGQHVLLIEDTWVTGANAQSAAVALHRAGAARVSVLCIARMLDAQWRDGEYLVSAYPSFSSPSVSTSIF